MSETLRSSERLPVTADNAYKRVLRRLERSTTWDGAIDAVAPVAHRLIAHAPARRFFHGDATGLPLHGILTDLPLGAWFTAPFLDLFRDDGSASRGDPADGARRHGRGADSGGRLGGVGGADAPPGGSA